MTTLEEMLSTRKAYTAEGVEFELHSGLSANSTRKITNLVRQLEARKTLEIGMAMGCSTLAIIDGLASNGQHTAIDPNQTSSSTFGWHGIGLESVKRAGHADKLRLLEGPSYKDLPRLLEAGEIFDFILIDGWHSFDYSFVDYFYSDLLLRDGGLLVFDDWWQPQVYQVTRFIETHKPYQRLGPELESPLGLRFNLRRLARRLLNKRSTEGEWGTITAYRKLRTTQVPSDFYYSNFYRHYGAFPFWGWLRGQKRAPY